MNHSLVQRGDNYPDTHRACNTEATTVLSLRREDGGTTTKELLALADFLHEQGCPHAAMESTGIYYVPGRKTDVNDATWVSELLAHGLIRASFVPPTPVQEMRDLTRTRKQLVREAAQHTQRIQKTLEDANIKLTSVLTDVLGVSGRAILEALAKGETDPEKLSALTRRGIKASREEIVEALRGHVREHHRFLLKLPLAQIDALAAAVRDVEERLGEALKPFRDLEELGAQA